MGIGPHQKSDPDRHADKAGHEERPHPPRLDCASKRPDGAELDRQAARYDEGRGVDRVERLKPDGGRDDAEGKTRPTGREPSDECADCDDDEQVRLQQCQHGGITEH